jgi:hypothetical protein
VTFEPRHSDQPESGIRDAGPGRGWLAPAVWAVTAALAAVAPNLSFYSFGLGVDEDGFGRLHLGVVANDGIFYGGAGSQHDPRGGIALVVAAVLVLIGVVWSLTRPGRAAALCATAGSVATAFAALGTVLDAQSEVSNNTGRVHIRIEAGVWLALAAGVVAVAGALLGGRRVLAD